MHTLNHYRSVLSIKVTYQMRIVPRHTSRIRRLHKPHLDSLTTGRISITREIQSLFLWHSILLLLLNCNNLHHSTLLSPAYDLRPQPRLPNTFLAQDTLATRAWLLFIDFLPLIEAVVKKSCRGVIVLVFPRRLWSCARYRRERSEPPLILRSLWRR